MNFKFEYNTEETLVLRSQSFENVSIDDLRSMALWKLSRIINVPDELLENLSCLAQNKDCLVDSQDTILILDELVSCDGVGHPMASTFLKFIRPDAFPIIDVRAYRTLTGKRLRYNQYSTKLHIDYALELHKIAESLDLALASVDEQLYCYDKEHNGKIND
ncbi:hypothetical protein MNBD_GAMMA02-1416 [hydrothermal vent metagenome]|uniref:Uncharacterized protein n=1 Tax=hydrothermal vent metagenome TaxID=652676 RepID=A0A3B0VUV7_9ZZZZ